MPYTQHTSESVSDGHPDKIADQISDAVLDAVLSQDPLGRVACEVLVKERMVVISGEVSADATIDYMKIVCQVLTGVYGKPCHPEDIELMLHVGQQSKEIAHGVDQHESLGAGDQGMMYGYACDETPAYMPMPIYLSHQLMRAHKKLRQTDPRILADAKSQVTVSYEGGVPSGIKSVVLSTQHQADMPLEEVRSFIQSSLIDLVIPKALVNKDTVYFVNPSGTFIRGGPSADCGLTGRKLMVDTYGGFALHGGGAFSGKDSTKVDRTAAYMARYVAKHVVAAGVAKQCELCLAYAIGVEHPVMVALDTFGTNTIPEDKILRMVRTVFDFSPKGMIDALQLQTPRFLPTAAFGHFGREGDAFSWERLDRLDDLHGFED
ncbi:methionine adenosyltransferase [Candidatus Synchoanobacter obligatus]|uniref:Methionine adenosyltransferase n=1 Tax=Candidatus Synchoanobacter obligatus TaxID=2919597 RepID=A0ABT1L519_9GAMM|nr:methionine adenosyltransferase [Candidatus Synchoanobacter obligatus]MCP8352274.1 methionine adenosyltransferase [Candidatus Synchoanobacter obligatus]